MDRLPTTGLQIITSSLYVCDVVYSLLHVCEHWRPVQCTLQPNTKVWYADIQYWNAGYTGSVSKQTRPATFVLSRLWYFKSSIVLTLQIKIKSKPYSKGFLYSAVFVAVYLPVGGLGNCFGQFWQICSQSQIIVLCLLLFWF